MWMRRLAGKATRVSAWTAAGGRQEIGDATSALATLAVAPSGRTAIAYGAQEGTFVARGTTGGGFRKAENVDRAAVFGIAPGVAATGKGRVVIAWIDGQSRLVLRRADPGAPFGSAQVAQLRAQDAGTNLFRDDPSVVTTTDGRAIVVIRTVEFRAGAVADSRVEALDWPVTAARPSPAATLSRGAGAGPAAVVAQGGTAVIAWTQRPTGAPRSLWATRWTAKGPQKPSVYDTHALASPVLLTTARHGAVHAFYRAGGLRWFTVRLSAAGRYSGTTAVTPPNEAVAQIDVAGTGSHAAALWSSRPHVRLARPAP